MKAIVLHSGGLDSTVALYIAMKKYSQSQVMSLGVAYGQKHIKEISVAGELCKAIGVPREVVTMPSVFAGYGSSLIDEDFDQPALSYEQLRAEVGPSPTYVPFRNGNLLSIAVAVALVAQAREVWFAAHADDAHNWAYPDCTPGFIRAMTEAAEIGSYGQATIVAPFTQNTKADIVRIGYALKVPFEHTWSCYKGGEYHCGTCPTCISRKEAFIRASRLDLTIYVA